MIGIVTRFLGISAFRLYAYAAVVIAMIIAGLIIRQHFIDVGWQKAIERVQRQDSAAIDAAKKVDKRATECSETDGYWDVITQGCKLEDAR